MTKLSSVGCDKIIEHSLMFYYFLFQVAPRDKLLLYKCSDGWPKLCEFLGCQIPDEAFPHKNKKGEIIKEDMKQNKPGYRLIKREITMSVCAILSVVGYIVFQAARSSSLMFM